MQFIKQVTCCFSPSPPLLQALKSLADYDEDSDDEEKTEEHTETPAKRKKLDDT